MKYIIEVKYGIMTMPNHIYESFKLKKEIELIIEPYVGMIIRFNREAMEYKIKSIVYDINEQCSILQCSIGYVSTIPTFYYKNEEEYEKYYKEKKFPSYGLEFHYPLERYIEEKKRINSLMESIISKDGFEIVKNDFED
jgi:hypothetical protein